VNPYSITNQKKITGDLLPAVPDVIRRLMPFCPVVFSKQLFRPRIGEDVTQRNKKS